MKDIFRFQNHKKRIIIESRWSSGVPSLTLCCVLVIDFHNSQGLSCTGTPSSIRKPFSTPGAKWPRKGKFIALVCTTGKTFHQVLVFCPMSLFESCRVSPVDLQNSTPAHSHNSFPSGIAVEPGEQQALTYLNCERKVFWAGICLFPSSYPARYFRNEGFSLTGKEIELPWQPRPQHPFIYIGFDVRLAKSLNGLEFQSKRCPWSIWYGVWFSDQKLRRAKKRKVKVSQFAIAINTLTCPQRTHYTFSFTRLNWPFITRVPGVYLWIFQLSFFFSEAKLAHAHLALTPFSRTHPHLLFNMLWRNTGTHTNTLQTHTSLSHLFS